MPLSSVSSTIALISRIFDTRQTVRPIYPDTSPKPPCALTPIRSPLPRCSPEETGIPSAHIASFLDALRREESLHMHSVLIIRHGKIIAEAPFGEVDLRSWKHTFSACKSITALAAGILAGEGKLSPDERLVDIFENRIPAIQRLALRELTVRHLLTMTTGSSFNELAAMTERDWVKGFFSGSFDAGKFSYNSLNTYILSAIITERAECSLSEYLRPRLFEPLGITGYHWDTCPLGIEKGGWGLYIRPEDLAKIGLLVMQDGLWDGRQLVPAEWIHDAAHTRISTGEISPRCDYGYQIWTGRMHDTFLFNGMLGQNVYGLRENGILLVSHAANDELFQSSRYFALAEEYFLQNFKDTLPADPAGETALRNTLAYLQNGQPKMPEKKPKRSLFRRKSNPEDVPVLPAECTRLSGVRFDAADDNAPGASLVPVILQAVQNNYADGLRFLSFLESGEHFYMTYGEENASYFIPIGFSAGAEADISFHGVPYHIRTCGEFTHNEDGVPLLKIRIDFCETPQTRILKLYYTGANPYLEQSEVPGASFMHNGVLSVKQELLTAPLLGEAANLLDDDYLRYRIDKKFAPTLRMKASSFIPREWDIQ